MPQKRGAEEPWKGSREDVTLISRTSHQAHRLSPVWVLCWYILLTVSPPAVLAPNPARQGGDAARSLPSSPAWRSGQFGPCSGRAEDVCLVSLVTALPAPVITFSLCRLGQEQQRGNLEWLRSNTSLGTAGATSHGPCVPLGSLLLRVPNPKGTYQAQGCSNKFLQRQPEGSHHSLPCELGTQAPVLNCRRNYRNENVCAGRSQAGCASGGCERGSLRAWVRPYL